MKPTVSRRVKQRPSLPPWLLRPLAGKRLVAGHILMLISLCHFACLLGGEGQGEALLYMDVYMETVAVSAVLLWAGVLGLDWLERRTNSSR